MYAEGTTCGANCVAPNVAVSAYGRLDELWGVRIIGTGPGTGTGGTGTGTGTGSYLKKA